MAREQTVFSELAVGAAINNDLIESIVNVDDDALMKYEAEKNKRLKEKDASKKISETTLKKAGYLVRDWLVNTKKLTSYSVEWTGMDATKDGSPVAKDLIIRPENIRISVKENAQLFQNPSPVQVFDKWSRGVLFTNAKDADWFLKVAKKELNDYFLACDGAVITKQPSIEDYYKNVKGYTSVDDKKIKNRKAFTEYVASLHKNKNSKAINAYKAFCDKVSKESAAIFNQNISSTFPDFQSKDCDIDLLTNLFSVFFKLDRTEYILAGTEGNKEFAVLMGDIDAWRRAYSIKEIKAEPISAGQPEVLIGFTFVEAATNKVFTFSIKCEVRWSHGKFCGNPESKLYKHKHWKYKELPWAKII